MNKKIHLFTNSYPYSKKETFLESEIKYLPAGSYVHPQYLDKYIRQLPGSVILENSLSKKQNSKVDKLSMIFLHPLNLVRFIFEDMKENDFNLSLLIPIIKKSIYLIQCLEWIEKMKLELSNSICYTYWFTTLTYALSLKKKELNAKIVTRAHGFDLYFERQLNSYIPFRSQSVKLIDRIYCVSDFGSKYLKSHFPDKADKIETAYLGTNIISKKKLIRFEDNPAINVVSCAYVIPEKRIDLVLDYLCKYSIESNKRVCWTHIGGKINKYCGSENLHIEWIESLTNEEIHKYYLQNNLNVFISLSSTEGLPVSMMEAQSYFIPVIATDVGGVSEIVNMSNGYLLSPNPDYSEFEVALNVVLEDNFLKKNESFKSWESRFNADKNYSTFYLNIGINA